jgi:hypothetical protein
MGTPPSIVVFRSVLEKIEHSSSLYVGFRQLEERGSVFFRVQRLPTRLEKLIAQDDLVVCGVFRANAQSDEISFAVDFRDRSDRVNRALLSWADVYFKRSVRSGQALSADPHLQKKIYFFGLNFAARNSLMCKDSFALFKSFISNPNARSMARAKAYVSLPSLSRFEQTAEAPVKDAVIFQTRVWTPSDVPEGNSETLNESRVGLVRELKKHFGHRFQGGLVPTALALARYPEFVSPLPSKRSLYALLAKQNLIGIYSEGLSGSTAFKFQEYLAGAQCIVSEKVSNELPIGCEDGQNYLGFLNVSDCIVKCELLLTQPSLAKCMRLANERLYKEVASPRAKAQNMLLILEQAHGVGDRS